MSRQYYINTNNGTSDLIEASTPEKALQQYLDNDGITAKIYKLGSSLNANVVVTDEGNKKESYYQVLA